MKRLFVSLLTLIWLTVPGVASAALNPLDSACSTGNGNQSSACSKASSATPQSIIKKASLIIASIAGVAAVIVIAIGGLQYVVSGGDPQKTANARNAIVGGAIGLGIIVAAQGIIIFVLTKLQ